MVAAQLQTAVAPRGKGKIAVEVSECFRPALRQYRPQEGPVGLVLALT